jgi:hypothetical protein
VTRIVQYGAPRTISTLVQRMGRAGRGPGFRGTAIVLTDPKQLPETHRPSPVIKRKNDGPVTDARPTKRKALASKLDVLATSSIKQEPNEDTTMVDGTINKGDQIPAEEGKCTTGVVQKKVKNSKTNHKMELEDSMLYLVTPPNAANAKVPSCRVKVMDEYFGNDKLRKGSLTRKDNVTKYLIATPEPCCDRCNPPPKCDSCGRCDLCDPTLVEKHVGDIDIVPPKKRVVVRKPKEEDHEKCETLRNLLVNWRDEKAKDASNGYGGLWFLPNLALTRIINAAQQTKGAPSSTQELEAETRWSPARIYGEELLPLIHSVFPSRTDVEKATQAKPCSTSVKQFTCGACGALGHRSRSFLSFLP